LPKPRLILASTSPQRSRLLAEAGYHFTVVAPEVSEPDPARFADAMAYVEHTAWLKARSVAEPLDQGIVLAADTAVVLRDQIIGKPTDRADARRILSALAGSEHQVLTGVCLWRQPAGFWIGATDQTWLRMRELSIADIDAYLASGRWVDKAGAYAIQEPDPFVTIVRGSHTNVVGLPVELLSRLLAQTIQAG
jgi:septum formation protein